MSAPEDVAAMRAALASVFQQIVFTPAKVSDAQVPENAAVVFGATELVPVLRHDLVPAKKTPAGHPPGDR